MFFYCRIIPSNPGKKHTTINTPETTGNFLLYLDHPQITLNLHVSYTALKCTLQ